MDVCTCAVDDSQACAYCRAQPLPDWLENASTTNIMGRLGGVSVKNMLERWAPPLTIDGNVTVSGKPDVVGIHAPADCVPAPPHCAEGVYTQHYGRAYRPQNLDAGDTALEQIGDRLGLPRGFDPIAARVKIARMDAAWRKPDAFRDSSKTAEQLHERSQLTPKPHLRLRCTLVADGGLSWAIEGPGWRTPPSKGVWWAHCAKAIEDAGCVPTWTDPTRYRK